MCLNTCRLILPSLNTHHRIQQRERRQIQEGPSRFASHRVVHMVELINDVVSQVCVGCRETDRSTLCASSQHKAAPARHTDQDVQDEGDDAGRQHAEDGFPPIPLAVDKHQAHIFEVAHGPGEELHQGVGQAVAGQHFHRILLDFGYASVESLEQMLRPKGDRESVISDQITGFLTALLLSRRSRRWDFC